MGKSMPSTGANGHKRQPSNAATTTRIVRCSEGLSVVSLQRPRERRAQQTPRHRPMMQPALVRGTLLSAAANKTSTLIGLHIDNSASQPLSNSELADLDAALYVTLLHLIHHEFWSKHLNASKCTDHDLRTEMHSYARTLPCSCTPERQLRRCKRVCRSRGRMVCRSKCTTSCKRVGQGYANAVSRCMVAQLHKKIPQTGPDSVIHVQSVCLHSSQNSIPAVCIDILKPADVRFTTAYSQTPC